MATGVKNGVVRVWDIREQKTIKELTQGQGNNEVCDISFSNKGLLFAVAWKNSPITRIFDLRKLDKDIIELTNDNPASIVNSVNFDSFGTYLATGSGKDVKMYAGKQWN